MQNPFKVASGRLPGVKKKDVVPAVVTPCDRGGAEGSFYQATNGAVGYLIGKGTKWCNITHSAPRNSDIDLNEN